MTPKNRANIQDIGSHRSLKKNGRVYGRAGGREAKGNTGEVTQEQIVAERSALLEDKQGEMEAVLDKHDNLLREAFQLEQFRSILLYDPVGAKADNSAVWREYKMNHDLLEKSPTNEGSSSRTTRRAHTERLQLFKSPTMDPSSTTLSRKKGLVKQNTAKSDDGALWSILAEARGKGKATDISERSRHKTSEKGKSKTASTHTPSRRPRIIALDPLPDTQNDSISQAGASSPAPSQSGPGRPSRKRPGGEIESISKNGHLQTSTPRKKIRKEEGLSRNMPPPPSVPNGRFSRRLRDESQRSVSADPLNLANDHKSLPIASVASGRASRYNQSSASYSGPPTSPTKSGITRIKLIVRRPPPALSHHRQRPPPPQYGLSLDNFFSSYTTFHDQDFTQEALEDLARSDAAILDKIEDFRRQGRLLPRLDVGSGVITTAAGTGHKRNPDLWDRIVDEAVARGRMRRNGGRQIASQIAGKVQGYWDSHTMREDKVKAQEERRLRLLAKATIKLVTGEWKKAVFHIREQERQKLDAEERRRGQSHLDAILDQSGHILETQQGDLAKGDASLSRSRSSSISASMRDWDTVSDEDQSQSSDEEDEEEQEQDEEERGEDDVEQDDEDDGGDEDEEEEVERAASEDMITYDAGEDYAAGEESPPRSVGSSLLGDSEDINLRRRSEDPDPLDNQTSTAVNALATLPGAPSSSPPIDDNDSFEMLLYPDTPTSRSEPSPTHSPRPESLPRDNLVTRDYDTVNSEMLDVELEGFDQGSLAPASSLRELAGNGSMESAPIDASPGDEPVVPVSNMETLPVETATATSSAIHPPVAVDSVADEFASPKKTNAYEPASIDEDSAPNLHAVERMEDEDESALIPDYLKPFAVAPVEWDPETKVRAPILLRGTLRPYQQSGLEWLASLHTNNLNGILADEMGLGKTIQTISLLAHLACDQGIWGPHLIIVPTSVLLNWEMEFKKFLPGFKTLSYHGTTKRRKELRQGWNDKHHFNVCITSYTLASRDAHIFKRKAWYYMILDEAHMIKNFKSQRWNILLMFRSFRRLLLTGTPLQNNLTELWALLQFLMSGTNFANLKEFGEWFSNPLEKAIEMGTMLDDENMQRVSKLHTVLRPYLLRRLKRDVEKELPSKYEHLVLCPLSKRQRFLYDEFMLRAQTRESLQSGVYQKIANILMQLRKVCNHPDLFEVRPIVTSFAMQRSAIADFEIQELMIRRRRMHSDAETVNLDILGYRFIDRQDTSVITALESQTLDASHNFPSISELSPNPPPNDTRTIEGFKEYVTYQQRAAVIARWAHNGYLNRLRCNQVPIYSRETLTIANTLYQPLLPLSAIDTRSNYLGRVNLVNSAIKSYSTRADELSSTVEKFAFVTPSVVALDMPRITLLGCEAPVTETLQDPSFDAVLHRSSVKLQIAFPDPSLLQYDCGKLQELTRLLREKKAGGHRVLIFTQMTKILDILEIFLNFHGYLYLRLDGATKIEDRQYITERFNADSRVFCFIASSRSGGVGINLTGADTVVFYDSDFNPQMDRQCEDRAHRIGQIRDVHIYRFVSSHTVEEAMLLKANQKRSLDDLVIQQGEFDWRSLFGDESVLSKALDETALTKALGEVEDTEDAHAAAVAAREEVVMEGADEADFGEDGGDVEVGEPKNDTFITPISGLRVNNVAMTEDGVVEDGDQEDEDEDVEDEGGTTVDYMLAFVRFDEDFFNEWRL